VNAASEFVRPFTLAEAERAPRRFAVEAEPREREALALRFGLPRIDRLAAEGTIRRHGSRWRLEARLAAELVQVCVVTLEPLPTAIAEDFVVDYAGEEGPGQRGEIDLAGDDAEPAPAGGILDLGEAVAQQLALALDPFPRRPGAVLPADPDPPAGPFAVLGRLKPGGGGGAP